MDPLTYYRHVECVACACLLYLEHYGRARLSLHPVGAFLDLKAFGLDSVYGDDLVTAHKARLAGRRVGIRFVYDDIAVLGLVYDRSDASVCVREHHLEVVILFLWNIYCIWVELLEHRVHASSHDPVHRERVHIRSVELAHYCVMNLGPLAEPEAF